MKLTYAIELLASIFIFGFTVTLAFWFLLILLDIVVRDFIKTWKKAEEVKL